MLAPSACAVRVLQLGLALILGMASSLFRVCSWMFRLRQLDASACVSVLQWSAEFDADGEWPDGEADGPSGELPPIVSAPATAAALLDFDDFDDAAQNGNGGESGGAEEGKDTDGSNGLLASNGGWDAEFEQALTPLLSLTHTQTHTHAHAWVRNHARAPVMVYSQLGIAPPSESDRRVADTLSKRHSAPHALAPTLHDLLRVSSLQVPPAPAPAPAPAADESWAAAFLPPDAAEAKSVEAPKRTEFEMYV
eukprot:6207806-Pleurochrysis_carterae.AAC.1